jgi:hypothetical protein
MLLNLLLASSFSFTRKDSLSRTDRRMKNIQFKAAVCEKDGVPIEDLADDDGCPATYIALYKKLPSSTDLTTELSSFHTDCVATICAKPTCVTLVNAATITYNEAFKDSLRTTCIPSGAAALSLDSCRNGDETIKTTLSDKESCLASYDALVAALPDADPAKKLNASFLAATQADFDKFLGDCLKSVCNKEECYTAIVESTPTGLNAALKTTLTSKCDPHPQTPPAGDEGIFTKNVHELFSAFGILLSFIIFWL